MRRTARISDNESQKDIDFSVGNKKMGATGANFGAADRMFTSMELRNNTGQHGGRGDQGDIDSQTALSQALNIDTTRREARALGIIGEEEDGTYAENTDDLKQTS